MTRKTLTLKKEKTPRELAKEYLLGFPAIEQNLPLAVDIHKMVLQHSPEDVSNKSLRLALWKHTQRKSYRRQIAQPGSMRHWLDGTPIEPVSNTHRKRMVKELGEATVG